MKRIISVIGSGIGGLAAGCRLAMQGHNVTIYEKNDKPGGKAAGIEIEGIWLDSAPTILRMPHLLEDLFSHAPDEIRLKVRLERLDTHYRFFLEDGLQYFDVFNNKTGTVESIRKFSSSDADRYGEFLAKSQRFYQMSLRTDPQPQQSSLQKFIHSCLPHRPTQSPMNLSLFQFTSRLFREELIQSSLSFYPLFFGQNPLTVPDNTAMIHAIEQQWGIAYPSGGIRNLVYSLVDYFQFLGGNLVLNADVTQVVFKHDKVIGLRLQDDSLTQTDTVISNLTPYQTMRLLTEDYKKIPASQRNFGNSYLVLHAITRPLPGRENLLVHTFINPKNFQKTMQQIFRDKTLPDSPWVYIHIPNLPDQSSLLEKKDVVIAICPIPNLSSLPETQNYILHMRTLIIKTIERVIPQFEKLIIHEKITTPEDFLDTFSMEQGTNYQPFIPPQIQQLYYVGESAWRGLGLIGAISSAEEVAQKIGN